MKAVQTRKFGPPEGLQINEVDKPIPRKNEILVRIFATTVTSGDAILRNMKFPLNIIFSLVFGLGNNPVLGHELAGEIVEIGNDIKRFRVGDQVFGATGFKGGTQDQVFGATGFKGGTHAEYICLPEDSMVAIKPDNMTFEEAAAVPVGANTALYILKKGNIKANGKVLIYGASGSVGTYAIQLSRYFGADVTGVCSTSNRGRCYGGMQHIEYGFDQISRCRKSH